LSKPQSDGDKLYAGVRKLIAEHLDDLAQKDIVPTFPRSGVMTSNATLSSSAKPHSQKDGAVQEVGTTSGPTGPNVQSIEMVLEGERFLKALKALWEDHVSSMSKLRQILRYMVSLRLLKMRLCVS
jgi:cullin 3